MSRAGRRNGSRSTPSIWTSANVPRELPLPMFAGETLAPPRRSIARRGTELDRRPGCDGRNPFACRPGRVPFAALRQAWANGDSLRPRSAHLIVTGPAVREPGA